MAHGTHTELPSACARARDVLQRVVAGLVEPSDDRVAAADAHLDSCAECWLLACAPEHLDGGEDDHAALTLHLGELAGDAGAPAADRAAALAWLVNRRPLPPHALATLVASFAEIGEAALATAAGEALPRLLASAGDAGRARVSPALEDLRDGARSRVIQAAAQAALPAATSPLRRVAEAAGERAADLLVSLWFAPLALRAPTLEFSLLAQDGDAAARGQVFLDDDGCVSVKLSGLPEAFEGSWPLLRVRRDGGGTRVLAAAAGCVVDATIVIQVDAQAGSPHATAQALAAGVQLTARGVAADPPRWTSIAFIAMTPERMAEAYAEHEAKLSAYARRMAGRFDLPQHAADEALGKLGVEIAKPRTAPPPPENFLAWSMSVIRNALLDVKRKPI